MFSFFLNGFRFLKILATGLKNDGEFRFLFIFIILLLVGSTSFYVKMEGWSVVDALYFSIMTMSTVGYGDVVPTTEVGKLFTMLYAFLAIGTFVSFTVKCVQIMFINRQNKTEKRLQKKEEKQQKD